MKILKNPKTAALSAVSALSLFSAGAFAQVHVLDNPGWYASGVLSGAVSVRGQGPDVTLSGVRPLTLQGQTHYGNGYAGGVSLGQQMRTASEDVRPLRLEGEYWITRFDRRSMQVGQFTSNSADLIRAQALFVNGLVRIGQTGEGRWWAGAGLGYASVDTPASAVQVPACNCLGRDKADGLAWRLKLQGEHPLNADSMLFLEFGLVKLPSGTVSNSSSVTRYDGATVRQVGMGIRTRF